MSNVLPAWPLLTAFIAASFVLAVTPGPGVFYIVARSLAQGRRSGLVSTAGVALGNLGNAMGAAIGLGALLALSTAAFMAVKYAGAAYLVYLGVKMLRAPRAGAPVTEVGVSRDLPLFRDGFLVALLNPKTAVFFAAFLPQFMSPDAAPILQSVTLGVIFVAIAAVTDSVYALAAGSAAPLLARADGVQRFGRYAARGPVIGVGVGAGWGGGNRARSLA
jgi:threonine/homoserine/homoserine lactone efflux protein